MQCNQTYVPDKAHEVNEPTEQLYYSKVMPQSCLPSLDCPASWNTLLQRESVEEFQQETKQAMNSPYSNCHRSQEYHWLIEENLIEQESAWGRRVWMVGLTCFAA